MGSSAPKSETPMRTWTASETPGNQESWQSTPMVFHDTTITCYNCHKPGHITTVCPEPRKADLKEIEEDEDIYNESGKEEP